MRCQMHWELGAQDCEGQDAGCRMQTEQESLVSWRDVVYVYVRAEEGKKVQEAAARSVDQSVRRSGSGCVFCVSVGCRCLSHRHMRMTEDD